MIKILMHGCNGKMGRMITEIAKQDQDVEIVAGVDKYTAVANEYPVFETISECDVDADAVIDFSNAGAVMNCWIIVLRRNFRQSSVQQDCQKSSLQG